MTELDAAALKVDMRQLIKTQGLRVACECLLEILQAAQMLMEAIDEENKKR